MKKSVVIIGGGLGGLFTGAVLSKEGIDVTVIEKNSAIGGGLQSFKRFGETFDAGMHIIGGMYEGGSVQRLCNYLDITERMNYVPVDDDCIDELYFGEDNRTYRIGKGKDGFIKSLAEHFPDQEDNLKRYVEAMYALTQETNLFYLRPSSDNLFAHSDEYLMPVKAFIAKYISDEKLQSVVAYMNPLYAGMADKTPAYIHSIINILYINGASRFVGGSSRFADLLKDYIEENGGKVLSGNPVTAISTEERTITSVKTQNGDVMTADYYISAIHPCSMIELLEDKKAFPKSFRTRLSEIPNAYSAFTLYIKMKPGTLRYFNHTNYYMSQYDEIWNFDKHDEKWPRGIMYMTPPDDNQGEYSNRLIVTTPMTWEAVRQWEHTTLGNREESYKAWKEEIMNMMLDKLEKVLPGVRQNIEAVNTSSPLTIRDYFNVKEGSMYGFVRECDNIALSQLPVVTKISNLLLTGQNNNLHGFCGVPLTAIQTCEAILGVNYLIDKLNGE